jgi:hypothetical protein
MTEEDIKKLQDAHDYWYKEWGKMQGLIDTLCVKSAERLNKVRYKLKTGSTLWEDTMHQLGTERGELESILRHFHGKLDEEYIHGHNLEPDKYWEE